jgi:hypothetical protein
MWKVVIVKQPTQNDFRSGFFPRLEYYKRDANKLAEEVKQKGGEAKVILSEEKD